MQKQNTKKLGAILSIFIATSAVAASIYLGYNQLNGRSQAGLGDMSIEGHRPDPIIDGDTDSALILGQNFQEQCEVYLGETNLASEFMNTESLEVQLPDTLPTDILEVRCPSGSETFRLNVSPALDELPE